MSAATERLVAWHAATTAGRAVSMRDGLVTEVVEGKSAYAYGYGAGAELTSITEPDGTRWGYAYGGDGRLTHVFRDGESFASYGYDAAGRLALVDRADGPRVHSYDDAGRLARTLRTDAGSFSYRYDAAGRVAAARCDAEESHFSYDDAGRVTGVLQQADGVALDARFDFDGEGRLARTRFPAWGIALHYEWDAKGRPFRLAWSAGGAEPRVLATFGTRETTDDGRLAWCDMGDGVREESWHDAIDGRPVRKLLRRGETTLWERRFAYGPSLRLEREGDRTYAYDEVGRLAEAREGSRSWSFRYDERDDLVAGKDAGAVAVDDLDRVRGVLSDGKETVFRYNQAGELVDLRVNGDRVARFQYDHKGRLLAKATPAGRERYLYAADDGLLAIADADGAPRTIFLWLPTGLAAVLDFTRDPEGEPLFLHRDGRGNLVFVGDASGALDGPFSEDPFGLPARLPARVPYLHRDRAFHADLGLYRIGCRWYAPSLRRFLTPDSYTGAPDDERLVNPWLPAASQRPVRAQLLGEWLKQPRVRNRHAYCANDPVNRFDPNGHWSFGGVILSVLGAIWTLPNTLFGLAVEITILVGEVVRWLVYLFSWGNVSWQTPGIDVAASGRLNAFALVFTGGWLGSFDSLLGITFGNVFFVNKEWKQNQAFIDLPADVAPPAYDGTVTIPKDEVLYEHELRHVNQYAWFGPFFHLGLPVFGVYEWDVIFNGYQNAWLEKNARDFSGF